nr:MAG TPA: hypothetical protein [Caudoviricetes sp.]
MILFIILLINLMIDLIGNLKLMNMLIFLKGMRNMPQYISLLL